MIETQELDKCDCGVPTTYYDGTWVCNNCGAKHKKVKKFPRLKTWELVFVDFNCEWCNQAILETAPRGAYSRKKIFDAKQRHLKENLVCLEKQYRYDRSEN